MRRPGAALTPNASALRRTSVRGAGARIGWVLLAVGAVGCGRGGGTTPVAPMGLTPASRPVTFADRAKDLGIDIVHYTGAMGRHWYPEIIGSGVCVFDYDQDGWMDILFLNGAPLPQTPKPEAAPTLRLYRNAGGERFTDVTVAAGLAVTMYGMGAAAADVTGDGYPELYVTAVGKNRLFRNVGGARFEEVTDRAGVGDARWGMGAVWFDMDGDGDLDLFVANYVGWSAANDAGCGTPRGTAYCGPDSYPASRNVLYRNEGDLRFMDVSAEWRVTGPARAMGAVAADLDEDGRPDLIVANDRVPTQVYHNLGRRFEEVGVVSGLTHGATMNVMAGMGVAVFDHRNDGSLAVAVSNFSQDGLGFFERTDTRRMLFTQAAREAGVFLPSAPLLGFGTVAVETNNDGWRDLFITNGHVFDDIERTDPVVKFREPPLLLLNAGGGKFTDVSAQSGAVFAQPVLGRGAATGDFNNDGWPDLVVNTNGGPGQVLMNGGRPDAHWLTVMVAGDAPNRAAIGAMVEVVAGGMTQREWIQAGGSYLSQSEPRAHFGLGSLTTADAVRVHWPDGTTMNLGGVAADQCFVIRYGGRTGEAYPAGEAWPVVRPIVDR